MQEKSHSKTSTRCADKRTLPITTQTDMSTTSKEHDPIRNDARRIARQSKLGTEAACVHCGEAQWETLIPTPKSLLEAHHVVGHANDAELTVPLCRNCHAKLTEQLRQNGTSMGKPQTLLDRIVAILRGLAAFFRTLADKLSGWAEAVLRFIDGLDRIAPEWREMPEAA
jgi:hypothetical protein